MITRLIEMTPLTRFMSSALLATGVLMVFGGFSAALGFTPAGVVASLAAIATLLYAGGVWFGSAAPAAAAEPILVFDRALRVVCGAARGGHIAARFPEPARGEIERRCVAALLGETAHFICREYSDVVGFDVAPVRATDGTVLYGILIAGTAAPASAVAACIAS